MLAHNFNRQQIAEKRNRPFIPCARQWIDEEDVQAVVEILHSDFLTTGQKVPEFERALADFVGARVGLAVSSGTAALHAAMYGLDIGPGDEVIMPPMTFVATANAVVFQGARPVFADVDKDTLLIDPDAVEAKITPRTKAIVAVDYSGHPCDYDALGSIANHHGLALVADACHALGAKYKGKKVGTLADLTVFSFHPVKHITTGEGGMVVTDNPRFAERIRKFRNHGIKTDHRQRAEKGTWYYEMEDLGYNYRLTDIQCALGISQLRKLPPWVRRRREIARDYDAALVGFSGVKPLHVQDNVSHAYHLYVIRLDTAQLKTTRAEVFADLHMEGIGANVHYIPVHLHPFYRDRFGTGPGLCPVAEDAYERIISLPMFPAMTHQDVADVITALQKITERYRL